MNPKTFYQNRIFCVFWPSKHNVAVQIPYFKVTFCGKSMENLTRIIEKNECYPKFFHQNSSFDVFWTAKHDAAFLIS